MSKVSKRHGRRGPAESLVPKKWTFMVYLAGDNNLDANGAGDLAEMKRVGSSERLGLVAQFDRRGSGKPTRRFYLRRGTSLMADSVMALGETNTGSPAALVGFVRWAVEKYPAERYALVLWNHGAGWDDTDLYRSTKLRMIQRRAQGRIRHAFFRTTQAKLVHEASGSPVARAILFDDNARDFLDNVEMKAALLAIKKIIGRKIDLLGMDACLMSMAEVLYQIRGSVQCAVGSEETEPAEGWPYDAVLGALARQPGMAPGALAATIVDKYAASYSAGDSVTQAATDLARVEPLAATVGSLTTALSAALDAPELRQAVMAARQQVQSYEVADNVDLVDFCQLLAAKVEAGSGIERACHQVIAVAAKENGLVLNARGKGAGVQNSHGLAIYFPTRLVSPLYPRLDFAKATKWGDFLKKYLTVTRSR
jgi:hypothetical protein